jgi:hypothetical protein
MSGCLPGSGRAFRLQCQRPTPYAAHGSEVNGPAYSRVRSSRLGFLLACQKPLPGRVTNAEKTLGVSAGRGLGCPALFLQFTLELVNRQI